MFTLQNKFGLVYQGALTENVAGQVNIHNITYKNINWIEISANVYTPANYDSQKNILLLLLLTLMVELKNKLLDFLHKS